MTTHIQYLNGGILWRSRPIPDGYHSVQPYLIVNDAMKAIEFYKKAFGAKERFCMKCPNGRTAHAEIEIGDCCIMMSDENPKFQASSPTRYKGSPISLLIYTEDCDAMYKQALQAEAKSLQEPTNQFYGDRSAGFSIRLATVGTFPLTSRMYPKRTWKRCTREGPIQSSVFPQRLKPL